MVAAAAAFKKNGLDLPGPLFVFDQTGSTNDLAAQGGRDAQPWWSCWLAEQQTAGRGRDGRRWQTFAYTSLAFSVLLPAMPETLPLVISLSLAEAVRETTGTLVMIKWPNDLLLNGKKLAGILTERYQWQGQPYYVVGIGLNVNQPLEAYALDGEAPVTLQDVLGQEVSREALLENILWHIKKDCLALDEHGFSTFVERYKRLCGSLGQEVVWRNSQHSVQGLARDIDAQGQLILDTAQGVLVCRAGDITQRKDT